MSVPLKSNSSIEKTLSLWPIANHIAGTHKHGTEISFSYDWFSQT